MNRNTSTSASLSGLGAREAIERVRRGELRAEDSVADLLGRQRRLASLNALTRIDEQQVLEDARRIDRKRAAGAVLGVLAGLPVVIKDNIAVAGTPNAAGTLTLRDNVARQNAPVVQRLLDQDAIFFARANMHELAGGGTSSNPSFGVVGNPYDPQRVPGGSSGGTAAALAARLAPAGLGSDTAGSVRIPSALCGTAGLRPTIRPHKLYPDEGVVPLAADLDTVGPMATTVADLALLHEAITGVSTRTRPDANSLRIGIPRKPYWEDLEPEVYEVSRQALDRWRDAGVTLVDVDVSSYYPLAHEIYMTLVTQGIKEDLAPYLDKVGATVTLPQIVAHIASRDTRTLFEDCAKSAIAPATLAKARGPLRDKVLQSYTELFRIHGIGAIAFPASPIVAPLINPEGDTREAQIELNGRRVNLGQTLFRNTRVTGALGAPGLSLPAGLTRSGLPVGLELDGLAGADASLIAMGMELERWLGPLPAPPSV
ncbi:MAG TPA: amidase family protein [Steroidobacteraceae bacterium]|nr:amidase family protein [Steroidobacteraceae bacterium]